MTQTLEAIFDGTALHPEKPLNLQRNTRVRITIEVDEEENVKPRSFLRTARELNLQGSSDWSEKIDDYLYGTPDNVAE